MQTIPAEIQTLVDWGQQVIESEIQERERKEAERQAQIDAAWKEEELHCITALPEVLRPYARLSHHHDSWPTDEPVGVRYVVMNIPLLTEICVRVAVPERTLCQFTHNGGNLGRWRVSGSWAHEYFYRDDLAIALAVAAAEWRKEQRMHCPRCHPDAEGELCDEHAREQAAVPAVQACEVQYMTGRAADPAVDRAEGEVPA